MIVLAREVPGAMIAKTTRFADIDMDSLDFIDLIGKVEDEFDITLANAKLSQVRTVADLSALVKAAHDLSN